MSEIKFSELEGKGVLSQDGREVGVVDDIVVDYEAWTVRTLVVKLERELLEQFHMKKPMFGTQTIQIPVSYVSGVSDKVILQKKLEELTAAAREKAVGADEEAEEEADEKADEEA